MSTKLNAEELAAQYIPDWSENDFTTKRRGFAMCVEKLAQPIADERDEYREALEMISTASSRGFGIDYVNGLCRSVLDKYPNP